MSAAVKEIEGESAVRSATAGGAIVAHSLPTQAQQWAAAGVWETGSRGDLWDLAEYNHKIRISPRNPGHHWPHTAHTVSL